MAVEVGKVPENPAYNIADIRFEHEAGGYVTIWFDIDGPSFEEPEVMKNIFVGFDEFLDNLKAQQQALYNTLNEKRVEQHWQWLERLDASGFDWKRYLRGYIDQCVDLRAAEKPREATRDRAPLRTTFVRVSGNRTRLFASRAPRAPPRPPPRARPWATCVRA